MRMPRSIWRGSHSLRLNGPLPAGLWHGRPQLAMMVRKSALRYTTGISQVVQPRKSPLRRFVAVVGLGVVFFTSGFIIALSPALPALNSLLNVPSNAESLTIFRPADKVTFQIEDGLVNHPLARNLRRNPDFTEARPHMKISEEMRGHNFTAGTLIGPGKLWVPPLAFFEKDGKSGVMLYYIGDDLCGHPRIVHGGLLATILDEGMARSCFGALPNKVALTANLTINYRAPLPTDSYVCLRATTTKVEGRKAWVEARIESLPENGEEVIVFVEATGLFIEPKQAATMAQLYPAAAG